MNFGRKTKHVKNCISGEIKLSLSARSISTFVYMVSCNMIGQGKSKTKKFAERNWGGINHAYGSYIATRRHHRTKYTQK